MPKFSKIQKNLFTFILLFSSVSLFIFLFSLTAKQVSAGCTGTVTCKMPYDTVCECNEGGPCEGNNPQTGDECTGTNGKDGTCQCENNCAGGNSEARDCTAFTTESACNDPCSDTCSVTSVSGGCTWTSQYSCNADNQCVSDPNGPYTSNDCGGNCTAPPAGKRYTCAKIDGNDICVENI